MNKEEILQMSREENAGKHDERELAALGSASRVGLAVGGLLCVALALISELALDNNLLSIAGWTVYLGLFGSQKLVLYKHLKKKSNLVFGIIYLAVAAVSVVMLFVKG